ncbi:MAG TPA: tetratricopeptide repeat protein, partial [Chitinophagaceae bacterium]
MQPTRYFTTAIICLILCQLSFSAFGQLGTVLDIKKPKEYEERVLRSEREDKKFTIPRRFMQNTVTHYNYFFNANNKINEILEKAKASFKDDYSQLLPFYNYTLEATAADSLQLDSVSYKSQTGIALHDLRNDWIDNLYLLWGASYYFRKQFDSAYLMFQYINFAFAEKEKDGYYKTIGSSRDGNAAYSISTKEKSGLVRKMLSEPPSRNEAFIWQIRNFLAQDQFAEAASLIVTLRNDPIFPKRLQNDLEEVQAFWFYKQNMWDSAAAHLELALGNATNKQEKARWEYLLAQLYELSGNYKEAENFYNKASGHTTDLILDVYARLYTIRVNKDGGENYIEKNIEDLLKMARRDKYSDYKDIIYYMAAQMQLERNNIDGALPLLLKSTQFNSNNLEQRNKAFLQLAELSFGKRLYRQAYNFYDSIRLDDPSLKNVTEIELRKEVLGRI